jgi:hypothetical protein
LRFRNKVIDLYTKYKSNRSRGEYIKFILQESESEKRKRKNDLGGQSSRTEKVIFIQGVCVQSFIKLRWP